MKRAKDFLKSGNKDRIICLPFIENKENADEVIKELDYIMKECGIRYYILAGTVLGFVRDKGFIPYDDDIDIGMYFDTKRQKIKFLQMIVSRGYSVLNCNGYSISRLNQEEITLEQYKNIQFYMLSADVGMVEYGLLKNNTLIGIFVLKDLPEYNKTMLGKGKRILPLSFFTDYDTVEYNNIHYKMPHPVEDYLVFTYGKDWRKPVDWKKRHQEDYQ